MTDRYKLIYRDKRFHVMARTAANAAWFSLGGSGDLGTALRLWSSLIGLEPRK
ncbi:MAG: hypothetical protein MRY81_13490 [Donghicola eburneus]|jgi:hypothetical protein|nr:hypothetical protein [Donghicola eburneus]MCI5040686.1 hypothetical protein [Donghicola eburneus]|tara:strand:+ start:2338 stop:2496 length:159 start_codon:yes stop_codon:yes gene_type:complete